MDRIEVMMDDGRWFSVCEWDPTEAGAQYDAVGWCDKFRERIGNSVAPLPEGGAIDLARFAAIRPVTG